MYKKFLPSKKFTIITLSIVGLAIVIFLFDRFLFKNNKISFNKDSNDEPQTLLVKNLVENDTDGDGIADWEESLWGTDPEKTDTNADGVPDGTEIAQKKKDIQAGNPDSNDENLNDTAKFSREFFSTVLSLQQSGNLNNETMSQLSNKIAENIKNEAQSQTYYTEKDIILTKTDDQKSQKAYYIKVLNTLKMYQNKNIGLELEIINKSINTQTSASLNGLTQISINYDKLAKDFLKIPVPSSISGDHIDFINSTENISKALITIQQLYENPVVGITGVSIYRNESDKFDILLEKLTSN